MISGFVDPWETLFMDLKIPNNFKKSNKKQSGEHASENVFLEIAFGQFRIVKMMERVGTHIHKYDWEMCFEWVRNFWC